MVFTQELLNTALKENGFEPLVLIDEETAGNMAKFDLVELALVQQEILTDLLETQILSQIDENTFYNPESAYYPFAKELGFED